MSALTYEYVQLETLVPGTHLYRQLDRLINFNHLCVKLRKIPKQGQGAHGYDIVSLFKALLIQYLEDLSDRQLERNLQENNASKLFCRFSLTDKTPDHTIFTRVRKKIGTEKLSKLFKKLQDQLKKEGLLLEHFTFVDATHLIRKEALWAERDESIRKKLATLNNKTVSKISHDKQARFGCKGKTKHWYGYKKHVSVDMQSGLINKVAVTPANKSDARGLSHICPRKGAVYGDKGYCTNPAQQTLKARGVHDGTIKKDNMKRKNKDLDRFHAHLRMPYERVFSQMRRRVRYVGIAKNQFSAFMNAMCFNLKRLLQLEVHHVCMS